MKLLFPLIILFSLILTGCNQKNSVPRQNPSISQNLNKAVVQGQQKINASFAIFINGSFRTFGAKMYHNLSPNVYIESENPNIVIVTKIGTTWQGFFNTLPMKLTVDCITTGTEETFCTTGTKKLKFYLNGKLEENLLGIEIKNGDKALISYGNETEAQIRNQLELIP